MKTGSDHQGKESARGAVLCGKEEYPERVEEVQNEKARRIKAAER
jgi:hypothetical protein